MSEKSLKVAFKNFSDSYEKLVEEINSTENIEIIERLEDSISREYPFHKSLDEIFISDWIEGILKSIDFDFEDLIGMTYDDAVDLLGEPSFSTDGGLYKGKKQWYFFQKDIKILVDKMSGVILEVVE